MRKILIFSIIGIALACLVLGTYALTQFDTVYNDANVIVWTAPGEYTWTTLDQVLNTDLIVVDSADAETHYAQFDTLLNTDNIIVEDATYDADGILEVPETIPERYEGTTLYESFSDVYLYWITDHWEDSSGDFRLRLRPTEGDLWRIYLDTGSGGSDITYKFIGQTPEGEYSGDWETTVTIV